MAKDYIIEWNDTTNYKNWSLADFVAWHRGLVRHFGNQKDEKGVLLTDKIWIVFWVASEGVAPYNKLGQIIVTPSKYEEETKYLKENAPVIYEASQIKSAVDLKTVNPLDLAYNTVGTTLKGANDIIDGLGTTAKIIGILIPLAVITAVIFLGIWAYKTFVVKKA